MVQSGIPNTVTDQRNRADWPTMYDLPSEEVGQSGVPDEFHIWQPQLLSLTFRPPAYPPETVFSAIGLNLYYDLQHPRWYKRPDWFGVVGGSRLYQGKELRQSYVCWQEPINPTIVIEFLSPGTEDEDLGQGIRDPQQPPMQWQVYEQILAVPYYVVFDSSTDQMRVFEWIEGHYQERVLGQPRVWFPRLQLGLGLWQGYWLKQERLWLRWFDGEGSWLLTPEEVEAKARRAAEACAQQTEHRATEAENRVAQLADRLRAMGINPDEL
ncbi:MAG: Uma2 family endonuclease [Cyanobacteriota bacterium]|nr:Uma2 family endonuclease [Cyanobacteriota bacterium]